MFCQALVAVVAPQAKFQQRLGQPNAGQRVETAESEARCVASYRVHFQDGHFETLLRQKIAAEATHDSATDDYHIACIVGQLPFSLLEDRPKAPGRNSAWSPLEFHFWFA